MEIPYISLHDLAAINDSMRTRVRHFDPNSGNSIKRINVTIKQNYTNKADLLRYLKVSYFFPGTYHALCIVFNNHNTLATFCAFDPFSL